jgi:hypothetical protein
MTQNTLCRQLIEPSLPALPALPFSGPANVSEGAGRYQVWPCFVFQADSSGLFGNVDAVIVRYS